jgi:hypothetical protein
LKPYSISSTPTIRRVAAKKTSAPASESRTRVCAGSVWDASVCMNNEGRREIGMETSNAKSERPLAARTTRGKGTAHSGATVFR